MSETSINSTLINFSSLQPVESALLANMPAISEALARVDGLVECAPVTSPSPKLSDSIKRERVLFTRDKVVWPFEAAMDALPINSDSVPAVMIRHAWQPGMASFSMTEWVRVLKPGGIWVALSANPWHPAVWSLLGRQTWRLPSWPHFLWGNSHPDLKWDLNPFRIGQRRWPTLSPVLAVVGRKRNRVAPLPSTRTRSIAVEQAPAMLTQCRAA